MAVKMIHCMQCGAKLTEKYLESEGKNIPFCPNCNDYRFPVFNTGVSMIIQNEKKDHILLIRQYGGDEYILCAGYVNQGEDAEDAAVREVKEELGLDVKEIKFNHTHFFIPSNTLMINFSVTVSDEAVHSNEEIDYWKWFTPEEAEQNIRKNSLAKAFLLGFLGKGFNFPVYPARPYR